MNAPLTTDRGESDFRVVVVDTDLAFAEALAGLLETQHDMVAVAVALGGLAEDRACDSVTVLLLDGDAADQVVREAIDRVRARAPEVSVILLVREASASRGKLARDVGATGWLTRHVEPDDLATAIRQAVLLGVVEPDRAMSNEPTATEAEAVAHLTVREHDVLRLVADGHDNVEIGLRLGISPQTVRTHVQNILAKLSVRSRSAMVAFAYRAGLVAPDHRNRDVP